MKIKRPQKIQTHLKIPAHDICQIIITDTDYEDVHTEEEVEEEDNTQEDTQDFQLIHLETDEELTKIEHVCAMVMTNDNIDTDRWVKFPLLFPSGRPHLNIKLHPELPVTKCLLDTGASPNLISNDLFLQVNQLVDNTLSTLPCEAQLKSHSGHLLEVIGSTVLQIQVEDSSGNFATFPPLPFIVTNDADKVLLGMQFIFQHTAQLNFDRTNPCRSTIDFHHRIFRPEFQQNLVMMDAPSTHWSFVLKPTRNVSVPPHKTALVECTICPQTHEPIDIRELQYAIAKLTIHHCSRRRPL